MQNDCVAEDLALLDTGVALKKLNYRFIAITPESHQRVLARDLSALDLQDIFGWNRVFAADVLSGQLFSALQQANVVRKEGEHFVSLIRFATLYDALYLHSGFPTAQHNAVFFGPATYRYARFLRQHVETARRVVDIGCGSGAGALCLRDRVEKMCLADINPQALRYAKINAQFADVVNRAEFVDSDVLSNVQGAFDLVISNPPYMVDDAMRAYRHGGQLFGAELSVRIVREGLERLAAGGQLILYTASAIVDGVDTFWQAVQPLLQAHECEVFYEEIDPDVFGEELERSAYQQVDRLAVVGLVVKL